MKHRRTLIVSLVVLVIAGTAVGTYWRRWSEPWYEGRSLRSWLEEGVSVRFDGDQEVAPSTKASEEAVRHMGTNAIPALLRMFRAEDSRLTQKLIALQNEFEFLPYPNTADYEHRLAALGFGWLGADATNAIPDLMGIYRQDIQQSEMVYGILLNIVPPAEKSVLLHEGLTNRFDQVRLKALCELTPTNTPETSVPLLIQGLADPSPMNRSIVASKLCKFGTNALPAVPALVPLAAMSATNPGYGPARHALIVLDRATAAKVLTNGPWTYERFTNRMGMMKNRRLQEFKKSVSRGSVDGSQTN